MKKKYTILRLLLGDQLNLQHSWFSEKRGDILYVLMEIRSETDYVWHHIQKACAFFAAMEQFAGILKNDGHEVVYIKLDDKDNQQSFAANCETLIRRYHIERFEYLQPDEYRVDTALRDFSNKLTIPSAMSDTEHFYTTRTELTEFFAGKKLILMENFYRAMRKKHNILMEGNEPAGQQWNFDHDNRKKLPRQHKPAPPLLFHNDVSQVHRRITEAGIRTIGLVTPNDLCWPLNREQSLALLQHFINECLPLFGTFQDAMQQHEWSLYHSRLSFSLNTKMISPAEVINAAIKSWQKHRNLIALNQLEGFIRQILGWREYMRGLYWMKMPSFEKINFFGHSRKLPDWYWTGQTKMNCMKQCISQSLRYAYAHHIQRLMITGNFALLAGIDPADVDFWYLGIYIDALQWVELPNTRGMSQYADGGITASKPYAGSANYIHKMSNYCEHCHYNHTERTGAKACPFNSLYWNFHDLHRDKLEKNPRISMVYRLWDKMDAGEREKILLTAAEHLKHLNKL
ncbi:MAG: cryptochrome/photolyase family protein [Citrobacter freundii]|nr:MAG: cryptochrome/photolyase family protein [Citrobacter freundii]